MFRKDRCIHVPKAAISLAGVWFFGSRLSANLPQCSRSHRWPAARRHAVCQVFWPKHAKHSPSECTRKSSANRKSTTWEMASAAVCQWPRRMTAVVREIHRHPPAETNRSKRIAIRSNCSTQTLLSRLPVVRDGLADRSLCASLSSIVDWDSLISVAEVPTTPSLTDVLASTNTQTKKETYYSNFLPFPLARVFQSAPAHTWATTFGEEGGIG